MFYGGTYAYNGSRAKNKYFILTIRGWLRHFEDYSIPKSPYFHQVWIDKDGENGILYFLILDKKRMNTIINIGGQKMSGYDVSDDVWNKIAKSKFGDCV